MGQKSAAYNDQGAIVGCYDDDICPVPSGINAIEITDEQFEAVKQSQYGWQGWTVANGALVEPVEPTATDLLVQAQAVQNAVLQQGCATAIVSGFASKALGSVYQYPSTLTDQQNQSTVANSESGGMLWCSNGATWGLVTHTQAQAQEVVASFAAWLNACQQQLVTLTDQVKASATPDAVQAIVWIAPAHS